MQTLTELHKRALAEKWAVPHFNFSSLAQLNGILDALRKMRAPALLGTSQSERSFVGAKQALYLIRSFRETEGIPVYLNADHHKTVEAAIEAFDAGYDSVHIDLSKEALESNTLGAKKVVEYIKSRRSDVEVEGELGYFVTDSSKIYKEVIEIPEDSYTQPKQAVEFVKETGVDRFAPAIGNRHGIAVNPKKIRFDLAKELRAALPDTTLVLHGGSGISDNDMRQLVAIGFNNIHISTELRVAFTEALRKDINANTEELAPYSYLKGARKAVCDLVKNKLELFGAVNRV